MDYVELQVTSNYSFLRGASHVEELCAQAAALGLPAIGLADRNSLAGVARAHHRAKEAGIRLLVGCRLDLDDGTSLLLYPQDRPAYARLCRLLTLGKARDAKNRGCVIGWDDLDPTGTIAIHVADEPGPGLASGLHRLRELYAERTHVALSVRRRPNDAVRLAAIAELARAARVATVATGDVLYHAPQPAHAAGRADLHPRRLHHRVRRVRGWKSTPNATCATARTSPACSTGSTRTPSRGPWKSRPRAASRSTNCATSIRRKPKPGQTAQQALEALTWASLPERYPAGAPDAVVAQLRHELALIAELDYAPYFLTVHSIVRFARGRGILCQGRGSAANSAVCYVIGITAIDPTESGLLFERFVSAATARAARHRRGFRARAARGRHPVGLRALRPRPRRPLRHHHPLPRPRRHPRGRQGARPAGGRDRRAVRAGLGLEPGRRAGRARGRASTSTCRTGGCGSRWSWRAS